VYSLMDDEKNILQVFATAEEGIGMAINDESVVYLSNADIKDLIRELRMRLK
jgi:hypothetical protein